MGFGLLFIGYLFFFSYPYKETLNIPPDLIGLIISYFGVKILAEYGCGWENLKKYFYILLPASTLNLVLQILNVVGINLGVEEIWSYAYEALIIVYNIMLLVSIYKIAEDTEVKSIQAKAKRNIFLMLVYYAVTFFFMIPLPFIQDAYTHLNVNYSFGLVLFLYYSLWRFLNLCIIFSCYMWICKEGDEDMPEKEHTFFFKKSKED